MEEKSYVGMGNCFFCNKPKEVILDRRLRKTLPREAVYNHEPCDECKKLMSLGIMFISTRDGETSITNPYRTGRVCVVKAESVEQWPLEPKLKAEILKKRFCFVEDKVWQEIGLPTEEKTLEQYEQEQEGK